MMLDPVLMSAHGPTAFNQLKYAWESGLGPTAVAKQLAGKHGTVSRPPGKKDWLLVRQKVLRRAVLLAALWLRDGKKVSTRLRSKGLMGHDQLDTVLVYPPNRAGRGVFCCCCCCCRFCCQGKASCNSFLSWPFWELELVQGEAGAARADDGAADFPGCWPVKHRGGGSGAGCFAG